MILVIDDEELILSLLSRILTWEGYHVACASNGQIALAQIQDTGYDAIICDLRMPVMDGLTFYEELARTSPDLAARVVFSTDVIIPETQNLLLETGRGVLPKPFQLEELYCVVERAIDNSPVESPHLQYDSLSWTSTG
ncbi:MAG: response regulator [Deltaproteobacteria bacterium]|nr:response regulator [Deltaproteobacteria bacterium]